ncbi:MFS transporter [Nocardiopsis chromatogenes]|uniref:MFS transporter n=1 Tax=Nocardiopsis chromatogenes TaxID=280239 RepID=UPI0003483C5C|nr:MFS transporter [Nocardiopsis chromatogenes]
MSTSTPETPPPASDTTGAAAPAARRRGGWPAVAAVAAGTFTVVTSEMLPVGLLTPIGGSLAVSEGTAGLTLTVTGLVAAVTAPFAPALIGRTDRRTALVLLTALLAGANLLSAWAPTFAVLVAARVLVGIGMGGVWALAAGLAPRLVPARSVGAATSLVFSGIAVASVLGVPLGAYIGALAGWREAFAVLGLLALLVAAALALLLPPLPADAPVRVRGALRLAVDPRVATGLAAAVLLVSGHFAAYTYVRPVLEGSAGIGAAMIGTLLLVYGIAGVVGNFLSGLGAARSVRSVLGVLALGLAAAVLLVPWAGVTVLGAGALMALWGLAYGGVSVASQTWMMKAAPKNTETVTALFVGVFNASIALGALVGGWAVDGFGGTSTMVLGGILALGALGVVLVGRSPQGKAAAAQKG